MTTTTATTGPLDRAALAPIYRDRPARRIPGTAAYALTMYASEDRSVRQYAIFTWYGAFLGHAHYQPKRRARTAGYTMTSSPSLNAEKWASLTEFTKAMAERHALTV